ncbi:unnamed protein product, partial [Mesorhabditis spiculigera]
MSTREELADTIAVALRGEDQFGYTDISDLGDAVLDSRYDLLAVADAVLADYQPKLRTVTTEAELDALPNMTVVMDNCDDVAQKRGGQWCGYETADLTSKQIANMSTYLEELATLAAKIGDDNAKATLDLGWIGPQERDALVDAAQQARKQLDKARTDLQQAQMTANTSNISQRDFSKLV